MSAGPAVTVLMPVYNGERHLRPAIESVLTQAFRDFEFLIVDDGSTDATADVVRTYDDPRIRLERFDRNRGLSAALNHGVALANGPLVARQDADDVSRPERLDAQIALMRAQPDLVLVGSQARKVDDAGRVIGTVNRPLEDLSIRWYALFDNPFIHTAVLVRRDAVRACGGFDPAFDPFSQDYALWWKVMRRGRVANVPEPLVDYRVNAGSIMGQLEAAPAAAPVATFDRIMRELALGHLVEAYGDRGLSHDEAALLAGFVEGIDAAGLSRFLEVFSRLADWYERDHPVVRRDRDFLRTLARQYDAIAYRARPGTRSQAARVYAHALGRRPALATALSWARVLAITLLGKRGRVTLARWRTWIASA